MEPTEIYSLTEIYDKYNDNMLDLSVEEKLKFQKALDQLQDENFLEKIYIQNKKTFLTSDKLIILL
jgi:hypothetical protein